MLLNPYWLLQIPRKTFKWLRLCNSWIIKWCIPNIQTLYLSCPLQVQCISKVKTWTIWKAAQHLNQTVININHFSFHSISLSILLKVNSLLFRNQSHSLKISLIYHCQLRAQPMWLWLKVIKILNWKSSKKTHRRVLHCKDVKVIKVFLAVVLLRWINNIHNTKSFITKTVFHHKLRTVKNQQSIIEEVR